MLKYGALSNLKFWNVRFSGHSIALVAVQTTEFSVQTRYPGTRWHFDFQSQKIVKQILTQFLKEAYIKFAKYVLQYFYHKVHY